ncbi:hypothetical protein RM530_02620 [Algiphilus sp. W345]|uniref:Uncharacterized protein n=1 Tax=Banduia mediterranea TaxID=3075609 RepID=A0ABU2WG71_9GAMM|nr:hypothetical protein [Algiphilus sp. W345]MDT0496261.1 hypothetical protein [Algiphilus sp. W345]
MNVAEMVLGAGALGTAAFGIVEAFKWSALGKAGFERLKSMPGEALLHSLSTSYGTDFELFLRARHRNPEGVGELRRSLRQGMRIGLRPGPAPALAAQVGTVDAAELTLVAERLMHGGPLDDASRTVLGRYELAVDARIDAGLTLAIDGYQGAIRAAASLSARQRHTPMNWSRNPTRTTRMPGRTSGSTPTRYLSNCWKANEPAPPKATLRGCCRVMPRRTGWPGSRAWRRCAACAGVVEQPWIPLGSPTRLVAAMS